MPYTVTANPQIKTAGAKSVVAESPSDALEKAKHFRLMGFKNVVIRDEGGREINEANLEGK